MNGHEKLIADVEELLKSVKLLTPGDFNSYMFDLPRFRLLAMLTVITNNLKDGKYTNQPGNWVDDLNSEEEIKL